MKQEKPADDGWEGLLGELATAEEGDGQPASTLEEVAQTEPQRPYTSPQELPEPGEAGAILLERAAEQVTMQDRPDPMTFTGWQPQGPIQPPETDDRESRDSQFDEKTDEFPALAQEPQTYRVLQVSYRAKELSTHTTSFDDGSKSILETVIMPASYEDGEEYKTAAAEALSRGPYDLMIIELSKREMRRAYEHKPENGSGEVYALARNREFNKREKKARYGESFREVTQGTRLAREDGQTGIYVLADSKTYDNSYMLLRELPDGNLSPIIDGLRKREDFDIDELKVYAGMHIESQQVPSVQ